MKKQETIKNFVQIKDNIPYKSVYKATFHLPVLEKKQSPKKSSIAH